MPIPSLDENGLLPIGVHDCTLEEVGRRFGRFQGSSQRQDLVIDLERFIREVRGTGLVRAVLIDGSFVTGVDHPNDIDLICVMNFKYKTVRRLTPTAYNVFSRKRARKRFGFDVILADDGSERYTEAVEFFQQVRNYPDRTKGILRIAL